MLECERFTALRTDVRSFSGMHSHMRQQMMLQHKCFATLFARMRPGFGCVIYRIQSCYFVIQRIYRILRQRMLNYMIRSRADTVASVLRSRRRIRGRVHIGDGCVIYGQRRRSRRQLTLKVLVIGAGQR